MKVQDIDPAHNVADHAQQPCIHCGDCALACPVALKPEVLFFAAVDEDFAVLRSGRLDACTDCQRCEEVCPSHIPLLDWFQWGKSELRQRATADAARKRFLAREARLARERRKRVPNRREAPSPALPAQTISRSEVLAAIARGRKKRRSSPR